MKPAIVIFLMLNFCLSLKAETVWFQMPGQVIPSLPKAGNLLSFLHSPMRRYMVALRDELFFANNENGCLEHEDIYKFCVSSEWVKERKVKRDSVRLFFNGNLVQEFFHVQEGSSLALTELDDLRSFNFRPQGIKGNYQAKGLTNITYNWSRETQAKVGERSILIFEPVNFFLEILYTGNEHMERIRYDVRCDFCFGIDWIEVQEMKREGLPNSVLYYSSSEPRDITPRLFDSLLRGAYFQPLNQLGATIQRTLVAEGGFRSLQF